MWQTAQENIDTKFVLLFCINISVGEFKNYTTFFLLLSFNTYDHKEDMKRNIYNTDEYYKLLTCFVLDNMLLLLFLSNKHCLTLDSSTKNKTSNKHNLVFSQKFSMIKKQRFIRHFRINLGTRKLSNKSLFFYHWKLLGKHEIMFIRCFIFGWWIQGQTMFIWEKQKQQHIVKNKTS
jgi:hypothetical protein